MRIAQVATLSSPVRRENAHSVEAIVYSLGAELTSLGHDVTTFGLAGSEVAGQFMATLPGSYGQNGSPDEWHLCEWINLCRAVEQSASFDILHTHSYLWGLPLDKLSRAPMVHTLHVTPYEDEVRLWSLASGAFVTAISRYQWSGFPDLIPTAIVHHGIDPNEFRFCGNPDDYVCFLGRFIPEKGALAAISIARALGIRLILAGEPNAYYRDEISPHVNGTTVKFVGRVTGCDRNRLLGGARALLYPIAAPEPFGLVMIEAMMCGTPVAAIKLGAVPEIVDEGITGYYANTVPELTQAVPRVLSLDRRRIRAQAELRFSARRMALQYAELYEKLSLQHASGS